MSDRIARLNGALEGRYVVERELGAGGMATVYLADDLRHGRTVAIKVLKPELAAVIAADRFLNEIRTTASLQHPNILPLFDSGDADRFLYYVMPYVEGESLRQRLDREGQLPVEEAVRIAVDVAEALASAHEHGVIHRDIKPANILLSHGRPVVADFGIALAVSAAGSGRLTETGLSLGTPYYMSPETMGDRDPGPAADVFSLGCVLYEMLVGEPPYTGPTVQAVMGRIIAGKPPRPSEWRKALPTHVEAAILVALEELPADRFPSASSFAEALTGRRPVALPDAAGGRQSRKTRLGHIAWGAAVLVVAAVAYLVGVARADRTSAQALTRVNIALPDSAPLAFVGSAPLAIGRASLALSEDGSTLVYVGLRSGVPRLEVRRLDSFETRELPGTDHAYSPFFSPNGRWIGFFVGNELRKVRVDGGTSIPIADAPNPMGADWAADGTIVFATLEGRRLLRVSDEGGRTEDLAIEGHYHAWPQVLPGGRILLSVHRSRSGVPPGGAWILDPVTRQYDEIPIPGDAARYLPSGHLVTIQGSVLRAARFDSERLEVTSPSVPVLSGVRSEIYAQGQWDVSAGGTLVYASGISIAEGPMMWVSNDAPPEPLPLPTRLRGTFAISPDGDRLAVAERRAGHSHIWVYELATGREKQLTVTGDNYGPVGWSPDGREVFFNRSPYAGGWLGPAFAQRVDGEGPPGVLLPELGDSVRAYSWSPSGLIGVARGPELEVVDPGTGTVTEIPTGDGFNWGLVISPAGNAVAYTSERTGEYHNYLQPFPPTGEELQISVAGGAEEPVWSRDGSRVYYRHGRRIMVVPVSTEPRLSVGAPEVFYDGDFVNVGWRSYDISRDGRRALAIDPGPVTAPSLNVVLGWVDEVKRRIQETERTGQNGR